MRSQIYIRAGLLTAGFFCLAGIDVRGQGATNAAAPRLSRQQAVREALERNPSIRAAREQVSEAKAGITIATAFPDPSLVAEVDQEKNYLDPKSGTERDVGVQFTLPYFYRTRLNRRIAEGGWQAAQYALTQLQQQIATQTAQAYDAVQVAIRHRDDLNQSKDISAQFLEKARTRFLAGTVPKLDTVKAAVELSRAENALMANERMIAIAQASLNHLLGRAMAVKLEDIDPLSVPAAVPELDALVQQAAVSRPELRSMSVQRKAAHDSTTLARQYWAPDVNMTLWKSQIDGAPDSYKFDGSISIPIFPWQHEKGQVAQAAHREQELEAAEQDLFSQVMLDVRNSHTTASISWRQVIFLRDQLLPEAHEQFDDTFTSYSLGGSSALDLLDAKSTLLDAESQYADALGAVNDAVADLERAVGAPLTNVVAQTHHEK